MKVLTVELIRGGGKSVIDSMWVNLEMSSDENIDNIMIEIKKYHESDGLEYVRQMIDDYGFVRIDEGSSSVWLND